MLIVFSLPFLSFPVCAKVVPLGLALGVRLFSLVFWGNFYIKGTLLYTGIYTMCIYRIIIIIIIIFA